MALCLIDIFILELVSNQLTVPVKIDGRQEQEETSAREYIYNIYSLVYTVYCEAGYRGVL